MQASAVLKSGPLVGGFNIPSYQKDPCRRTPIENPAPHMVQGSTGYWDTVLSYFFGVPGSDSSDHS